MRDQCETSAESSPSFVCAFILGGGIRQGLGKEQQLIYKILKESHKKVGFLLTGSSERKILDKFKKKCVSRRPVV